MIRVHYCLAGVKCTNCAERAPICWLSNAFRNGVGHHYSDWHHHIGIMQGVRRPGTLNMCHQRRHRQNQHNTKWHETCVEDTATKRTTPRVAVQATADDTSIDDTGQRERRTGSRWHKSHATCTMAHGMALRQASPITHTHTICAVEWIHRLTFCMNTFSGMLKCNRDAVYAKVGCLFTSPCIVCCVCARLFVDKMFGWWLNGWSVMLSVCVCATLDNAWAIAGDAHLRSFSSSTDHGCMLHCNESDCFGADKWPLECREYLEHIENG